MFSHSLFIIYCWLYLVYSLPDEPQNTYYKLYEAGKAAYNGERWYECAAFMRRALEDYKFYQGIVWNCQQRCDRHISTDPLQIDTTTSREEKGNAIFGNGGVSEARILEKFVKKALCLRRCKTDRLPGRPDDTNRVVDQEFRQLKPYSYMQICYWKLGDLDHAVSAAYTFLNRNPGDTLMSENLRFYTNEKAYSDSMAKDLEQKEYQTFYLDGATAYEELRFIDVIDKMERSMESYLEEYEKCRAMCDSTPSGDTPDLTDFYSAVTVFYMSVLQCRAKCENDLMMIRGNRMDDFMASHFHYLQYAYWKESNIRKSAEAVGTFLLFFPEDETMVHNKQYYLDNFNLKPEHFKPRSELVLYYRRLLLERRLLDFLTEKFKFEDDEYPKYHREDYQDIPDDIPGLENMEYLDWKEKNMSKQQEKTVDDGDAADRTNLPPAPAHNRKGDDGMILPTMAVSSPFWVPSNEMLDEYESKHGIRVVKKETELSGRYRFLADNILSTEECRSLLQLANLAELGDGYNGQESPHTKHEVFSGLTVTRIAELAADGTAPLDSAKLLLDKSELARDLVQTYFNLTTHLYFDYTHLVCRSAKEIGNDDIATVLRSDLSHAIHGDNCVFTDGRCDKTSPAYTWRDYSAVIYLNDDFVGGEFIFSDTNKDVQAEIRPKCGQMVGFSADTLHGVKAITRGSRCVIALWLTLDSSHEEHDRIRAQQMLAQIELANEENIELPLKPVSSSRNVEL